MAAPRNVFKDRLRSQQLGLFATLNSPALAELLAGCGFDWILIDTEHSPGEMADVVAQLHALQGREVSVIVRPAWSDMVLIKRLLDAGAQTLLIPNVQTAQEAATAVSYARYPPAGVRGVSSGSRAAQYGQSADYLRTADEQICILVQIETPRALDNLEAIAAVRGGWTDCSSAPTIWRPPWGTSVIRSTRWCKPPSMTRSNGCGRWTSSPAT